MSPQQIEEFKKRAKAAGKNDRDIDAFIRLKQNSLQAQKTQPTQSPSRNAEEEPKKEGFFKSVVKGIASPFLKLGATADALSTSKNLGGTGTNNSNRNTPFFGEVKPITTVKEAVGVGLELGSFAVPGAGAGGLAARAGQGALMGTLSGAGTALSDDADTSDVLASGLTGALFGGAVGGVGAVLGKMKGAGLGTLQSTLEKKNLKLTPLQAKKFGENFTPMIEIGSRMPQLGPRARAGYAQDLEEVMEKSLQSTFDSAQSKTMVPKSFIEQKVRAIPKLFSDDPAKLPRVEAVTRQILKDLKTRPDSLPLSTLNKFKRSYSKGTYDVGGRVKDEISDAISAMYREAVESVGDKSGLTIPLPAEVRQMFPELPPSLPVKTYNRLYGAIINYQKAISIAVERPETGFLNRLLAEIVGGGVGYSAGGPLGAAVGAVTGKVVSSNAPISAARSLVGRTAKPSKAIKPATLIGTQGLTQQLRPPE
jgi:hypothetical protein